MIRPIKRLSKLGTLFFGLGVLAGCPGLSTSESLTSDEALSEVLSNQCVWLRMQGATSIQFSRDGELLSSEAARSIIESQVTPGPINYVFSTRGAASYLRRQSPWIDILLNSGGQALTNNLDHLLLGQIDQTSQLNSIEPGHAWIMHGGRACGNSLSSYPRALELPAQYRGQAKLELISTLLSRLEQRKRNYILYSREDGRAVALNPEETEGPYNTNRNVHLVASNAHVTFLGQDALEGGADPSLFVKLAMYPVDYQMTCAYTGDLESGSIEGDDIHCTEIYTFDPLAESVWTYLVPVTQ